MFDFFLIWASAIKKFWQVKNFQVWVFEKIFGVKGKKTQQGVGANAVKRPPPMLCILVFSNYKIMPSWNEYFSTRID